MKWLLAVIIAYLIGAFPLHLWAVPRLSVAGRIPPPHALYPREAFLLVLIDVVKGMAATLLAFGVAGWAGACFAAVTVTLGSMYSVFLGFRGGRGLAVAAGALLILSPVLMFIGVIIWLLSLAATRYLFLASFFTTVGVILLGLVFISQMTVWFVVLVLGVLILLRLRPGWKRFRRGLEPPYRFKNPFR
ncbi:glycerol-3-phosphate acyltransferase [Staphylospora marina]|uniref:glycerol-3-phosphate acyltransferase n=1 Tax=Staphylospora marina TaxID=2490858 RepID=UPI000F5BB84F|nr:glycerol-3-phosphate acyltransferase [Staphylospora marina]